MSHPLFRGDTYRQALKDEKFHPISGSKNTREGEGRLPSRLASMEVLAEASWHPLIFSDLAPEKTAVCLHQTDRGSFGSTSGSLPPSQAPTTLTQEGRVPEQGVQQSSSWQEACKNMVSWAAWEDARHVCPASLKASLEQRTRGALAVEVLGEGGSPAFRNPSHLLACCLSDVHYASSLHVFPFSSL